MLVHQSLDCSVMVVVCGCESYFLWGVLVVMLFHCTVKVVVLLLVGGIYASRNLELLSVIEFQVLTMGLSNMGFCVFSLGSICVVLMFWIRVVVGSMFRYM